MAVQVPGDSANRAAAIGRLDCHVVIKADATTGTGEHFIRAQVAFLVHARMCFDGCTLATAATAALDEVAQLGGCGGLIAIAGDGQLVLPFNTPGMYRAWIDADGQVETAIYR